VDHRHKPSKIPKPPKPKAKARITRYKEAGVMTKDLCMEHRWQWGGNHAS